MPRPTDTRKRMVRTTARLLRRQGYAATGWRQVVADSATPWGSQAHHFPGGKEQLAAEAISLSGSGYERLLRVALTDSHPADAVRNLVEVAATELESSGWANGCPVATVALETAHRSDALAEACGGALSKWRGTIARSLLEHGVAPVQAHALATLVLAGMEGGLVMARANRDAEPLRTVGEELAALLRERIG
ncbi:MAG: TetR/AcrR family transcriptional regulator [Acidimicrobiales bacterium]|jgi:TetR/AcrR family transcriptional repressor of lmrAB and yxaGH operons